MTRDSAADRNQKIKERGWAGLSLLAAEGMGLAVRLAAGFVQALTEFAVLSFHSGQAAKQATVLPPEGLVFLGQHGQASAQVQQFQSKPLRARASSSASGMSSRVARRPRERDRPVNQTRVLTW
jgi:hypothetical protein